MGYISAATAKSILELIKIHQFKWKTTNKEDIGAFAQELYSIYPAAVTVGGWYDSETKTMKNTPIEGVMYTPWSVDYSKLVPIIVRITQDLETRLTVVEAAIANLI